MLQTETVEINGNTVVLCETTLRTDHLRAELLTKAGADSTGNTLDDLARWIYPSLVACVVSGNVPTLEQLVDIPLRELTAWREAAQRLNPSWFPALEAENGSEQEKKDS